MGELPVGLRTGSVNTARVVIVGSSCAGKSTLAAELAEIYGCACIDLDALHWGPNWVATPREVFRERVAAATAGPAWVVAGNYGSVRDLLWPRATLIIWLNYSFPTVLWRGVKRTLRRCFNREVLWNGNRESVRMSFFSKQSILLWIVTTFYRRRRELAALRASGAYPHLAWVELRAPSQARKMRWR